MLTIKNITKSGGVDAVRYYNHSTRYSKSDLMLYAARVNGAKYARVDLKHGKSIITHAVPGNAVITAKKPPKKAHKLFINRAIDYSGIGYDIYISDDEYYNDIIVINCDNRRTYTINNGRYASLYDNIVKYVSEYDALYCALEDVKNNIRGREYKTMRAAILDYLNVEVTAKQAGKVRAIVSKTTSAHYLNYYDEHERAADLLTVLTPHKWECQIIRGCCQGETATAIFPADVYSDEDIKFFEAFYFGKYYDYSITYCGETVGEFIPDYIAWDDEELYTRCIDAAGLPETFDRNNIVYTEEN